ncbi:unnamed protein product [Leptidea sinapis]|uniref:Endonuclease/exonuclease/phosphatase domain-containing protein n=1 Tax=Leptidea sinapis TaxID=189913 RepID=A0A5E4R8A2_9NEOP|nr:unnamed protein product [Leptidea sinapis]
MEELSGTISDNFGYTGTSASILSGRPYGGVALLYRKNAFSKVSVIECNNVRICGLKLTVSDSKSIVILCIYMPTNSNDNFVDFNDCLSAMHSIVEVEENSGVEAFYMLGDFNAHPNELFYNEMLSFCEDQIWICIDTNLCANNTYTFHSDAHGCNK